MLKRSRAAASASAPKRKTKWPDVMKAGIGLRGGPRGMLTRYSGRVPELKWVDIGNNNLTSASYAAPVTPINLFQTVQGGAGYQRIGQRVQLHSLQIRGQIYPTATQTGSCNLRVLVVYDRQANAAQCAYSDVITNVSAAGTATQSITGFVNMANRERFIVLIDEVLWCPALSIAGGSATVTGLVTGSDKVQSMFNFSRYVKLKGLETHFNNTNGGTYADIQTGMLTMFFAADGAGSTNWIFNWQSRVRFQDI